MKTLIENAQVVLPDVTMKTSVFLENGKIAEIGPTIQRAADRTIDGSGQFLIPGIIDDQVHFRDPGFPDKEDLYTGSRACAKGGVTTYLEMPNTKPSTTTVAALHAKLEMASKKSLVNYGFYIGATTDNLVELQKATRTPGIKIFIGSSTGPLLVDDQEILEKIFGETTLPCTAHCEDEATVRANMEKYSTSTDVADHSNIRSAEAAYISTKRATDLAKRHKKRFHVLHVSTGDELELLLDHQNLITAEVCPHHLFFNINDYKRLGTLVQMNPSIKTADDNERLWQGLLDGVIPVIATDHAPHTLAEKSAPYPQSPSGLPAVENSLALLLNEVNKGRCTLRQVVHWMATAPAKVWNIQNKGSIVVGYDADLVLVDLEKEETIKNENQQTKSRWSPWDGQSLRGWATHTWVHGHLVYCNGQFDESQYGQEATYDHSLGGYWG
ncbi:MAG: dihydroorotase [Pirellulaceae bacterium]|nr:dihydroorotase [Pirellulaceae bacterium]